MRILLVCILFSWSIHLVQSKPALVPASLSQRVSQSSLIVEGIVVSKNSYKHSSVNRIFTSNRLKVTSVIKGNIADTVIDIITQGGTLGNEMLVCHELASLRTGDKGIFFLIPSRYHELGYDIYTEKQGFLKQKDEPGIYSDLFLGTIYIDQILKELGSSKVKDPARKPDVIENKKSALIPVITSFSPTSLSAGTNTELTITGTGFGNTRGTIEFRNADDGGNTFIEPLSTEYKTWSDTKIIIEVPAGAGTGTFRVRTGSGFASSIDPLIIRFARTQVEYEGNAYSALLVDHMAGGYPWRMTNGFSNDSLARESFLRAFNKWRCVSGVNWFIGSETDADVTERDNLSVIRFDTGEELPSNVLGVCYSYYLGCTTTEWYVNEFDIVFDRDVRWEFGPDLPAGNEFDFESVAFHELGHGHQLGHVINQQDVMHYAIAPGTYQRDPNQDDIEGAKLVMKESARSICNFGSMQPITADVCEDSFFAYFENEPPHVYPVPVTDILYISYFLADNNDDVDISLYDMTGKKVIQFVKSPQKKGEHTITEHLGVHGIKKGAYILRSRINNEEYSRKIISVM